MTDTPLAILLIDDDDNDNFFHKRAIDKSGLNCMVDVCTTGVDALDYLQNKGAYADKDQPLPQPDIIFLDINMPMLNGWEFLEAYEELCRPPQVKAGVVIVMLTNSSSEQDQERALAISSVKEFMEKPLRSDGLVSIVEKYIASD